MKLIKYEAVPSFLLSISPPCERSSNRVGECFQTIEVQLLLFLQAIAKLEISLKYMIISAHPVISS